MQFRLFIKIIKVVLVFILLCFVSCDIADEKLLIVNLSSDTLFFITKPDTSIRVNDYPLFYKWKRDYRYIKENCVFPYEVKRDGVLNTTWEKAISKVPDKKIKIFFFKKKMLDKISWDQVVAMQKYSLKVVMSLSELEKANWVVRFQEPEANSVYEIR